MFIAQEKHVRNAKQILEKLKHVDFLVKMEEQFGNSSENYNNKSIQNDVVSTEIATTTYTENDTMMSTYAQLVTQESASILTNTEMNTFCTETYTMDTTTLSYSDTYTSEGVQNFTNCEVAKEIGNEFPEESYVTEDKVNTQTNTSQGK